MSRFKQISPRIAPSWQTLVSALLIAAAFPPWGLDVLVWIALVPWLSRLQRAGTRLEAVAQGFWLSFGVGILAAHWLAYAIHEFLEVSWVLAVAGLIVFAAACAQPHFLFFALLFHWMSGGGAKKPGAMWTVSTTVGAALGYTGIDWLVPRLFDVGLGYALPDATNLRQLASLGGVSLLTFVIVLVNLVAFQIAEVVVRQPRVNIAVAARIGAIVLICGVASSYGAIRNRRLAAIIDEPEWILRASLVQGNVPNDVRLAWARGDERAAERQLSAYMLPTEELIEKEPKPDLVVWPEATFPGIFRKAGSRFQEGRAVKFDRQVLRLNVPIVFGAYDMVEENGRPTLFNALFSITPRYEQPGRRGFVQRYRKHELLPFAETIPGLSESEWLRRLLPSVGFFGHGRGAEVFRLRVPDDRTVVLGPIICSESLHSRHVLNTARQGSQVILNVGSDGWFGTSGEPEFHLAISRFRSIETGLPQIRSANTGISALILPNGEIAARSELGKAQILNLEVPIVRDTETLMMRWGNWFGPAALALAIGFLSFHVTRRGSAR